VEATELILDQVEAVSFEKDKDASPIRGDEIYDSALALGANLGLGDLKWILDRQEEVADKFRGLVLVFTGTTLGLTEDTQCFPCLNFREGGCKLEFYRIKGSWSESSGFRLAGVKLEL
jgi:hypothetical protein